MRGKQLSSDAQHKCPKMFSFTLFALWSPWAPQACTGRWTGELRPELFWLRKSFQLLWVPTHEYEYNQSSPLPTFRLFCRPGLGKATIRQISKSLEGRDGRSCLPRKVITKNWPKTQDDGLSKLEEVTRVYVLDSMIQAKMYKMYMKNPG